MKHTLKRSLLISGLAMACSTTNARTIDFDDYFNKLHQEMDRMYAHMWDAFDGLLSESKQGKADVVDVDVVVLPGIAVQAAQDKKSLTITIKDLKLKKGDVNVDYEDKGVVTATFPHLEGSVTLKIYPRGIEIEAEKKIIQEKKDEKGKVLGSSSYTAYNASSQNFPIVVNVASIKKHHPQFKDGVLTLAFDVYETKEAITVE